MRLTEWLWVAIGGVAIGFVCVFIGLYLIFGPPPSRDTINITINCPKARESICHEMMDAAMNVARKYRIQEGEDG